MKWKLEETTEKIPTIVRYDLKIMRIIRKVGMSVRLQVLIMTDWLLVLVLMLMRRRRNIYKTQAERSCRCKCKFRDWYPFMSSNLAQASLTIENIVTEVLPT